MVENPNTVYIKILVDTLRKKKEILEFLTELTKEQEMLLKDSSFSMEQFEEAMEKKGKLIDNLNQLDDGFEAFYKRLEDVLPVEKENHRTELLEAQELIGKITDMSARLQALEAKNKESFARRLTEQKQEIKSFKTSSQTAGKYYQHMANQHQEGQSYFLDKKK